MLLIDNKFEKSSLNKFYYNDVKYRTSVGIDRINVRLFEKHISKYISDISRKVNNSTYKFTPYKELLINKGKERIPRVISIPTIRDKITLGVLKEILFRDSRHVAHHQLAQTIISNINKCKSEFDYFIKIDISNYYGSINHYHLESRMTEIGIDARIVALIMRALKTPTVDSGHRRQHREPNAIGVPQGLPMSNILATIYLSELDEKYSSNKYIKYFRYVDDILILCKKSRKNKILSAINEELEKKYHLSVNEDKCCDGDLITGFTYLGYVINDKETRIRQNNILRHEKSIENLFLDYVNHDKKNVEFFIWRLNQKISGCIKDGNKYGWLFYFSQMENKSTLYHFDWLVNSYIKRFKLAGSIDISRFKSYVRTYHEIRFNLHSTNYIPNYDEYDVEKKRLFLKNIAGIEVKPLDDYAVEIRFRKILFSSVKDLERDLQNFS